MTSKQQTCAERLPEQLAGRLEDFRAMFAVLDAEDMDDLSDDQISTAQNLREPDRSVSLYDLHDQVRDSILETPLAIETRKVHRVLLSTGGPGDWFEVETDESGYVWRVSYVFQDWFDVAREDLEGQDREDALRFCAEFIEDLR